MPVSGSFLDELVSRTDIVDLASGYVRFTKHSGANMFGLCPFHSEKTASFSVSADKQIYYCFGCGKGGGVINFVMEIENIPFRDAVEFLANRAGMIVPDDDGAVELAGKRKRMLELNRDTARHFHQMLFSSAGETAVRYLARRKISKAMVTKFGIGAAPDSWNSLLNAMKEKGYSRQELIDAGLARRGREDSSAYDVFRNRLMFPVIDVRGSVIGFSGRILGDGEPKYLNSPDTLVFSKSRNLFALNISKKSKSGMLILAEGNIDVVTLHDAGFDCAVASLGTALTQDQVRLMSRYTDKVILAYDSDEAGRKASLRAISLLEKTDLRVKVIDMGNSKDPDEFLKKKGSDAFRILLESSENHIEYRLMMIRKNADLTTDEGRLRYLAEATALLSELTSDPEREVYGARVAEVAGVSAGSVANEVKKAIRIRRSKQKKDFENQVSRPTAAIQPSDKTLRYENEYSAAAEEGLIRSLINEASYMKTAENAGFSAEEFTSPFLAKVFTIISDRVSSGRDISAQHILAGLEPNEAALLTTILQKTADFTHGGRTFGEYIEKIRMEKLKSANPDMDTLMEIKRLRGKADS